MSSQQAKLHMINLGLRIYLSYKGLFLWLNWPAFASNVFLAPVFMVVLFGLFGRFAIDGKTSQDFMVGMAALGVPSILLGGVLQTFYYERSMGVISVNFSSPSSRFALYASRVGLHLPNGVLAAASCIFISWLFLGLDVSETNWPAATCTMMLITVTCAAYALLVGPFVQITNDLLNILAISRGILLTLTGVIVPTEDLPGFLEEVSSVLPLTHGLAALRGSFRGENLGELGPDFILELLIGIVCLIGGYLIYLAVEGFAKHRGPLDLS